MHVLTKKYYEALDGKLFNTKEECFMYELKINNIDIDKDIVLFDNDDNKIDFSHYDESIIYNINMVIARSKEALHFINDFLKYYGYDIIDHDYKTNKKVYVYKHDCVCNDWSECDFEEMIKTSNKKLKILEEFEKAI